MPFKHTQSRFHCISQRRAKQHLKKTQLRFQLE